MSLRPGGSSGNLALGGWDEDERGGGSLRPVSLRPRGDLDDRTDNLGDRRGGKGGGGGRRGGGGGGGGGDERRGGGAGRNGGGGDPISSRLHCGEVVSLRESDGFGFIRPDAASGLQRMGARRWRHPRPRTYPLARAPPPRPHSLTLFSLTLFSLTLSL